jgi:hypothetical protein
MKTEKQAWAAWVKEWRTCGRLRGCAVFAIVTGDRQRKALGFDSPIRQQRSSTAKPALPEVSAGASTL